MPNTQGMCTSFKRDLLDGLHAFGTSVVRGATTPDTFKAALYLASATVDTTTTAYTTTGEVSGTGYTATGIAATFGTAPSISGTSGVVTPSASLVYTGVTLATAFDSVLIYNSTAAGKNAVSVHKFGSQTITAGDLTLTMPANAAGTALIELA
jgi:hypothetical protein